MRRLYHFGGLGFPQTTWGGLYSGLAPFCETEKPVAAVGFVTDIGFGAGVDLVAGVGLDALEAA